MSVNNLQDQKFPPMHGNPRIPENHCLSQKFMDAIVDEWIKIDAIHGEKIAADIKVGWLWTL